MSKDDRLKESATNFLISSALFDQIKLEAGNLKEISCLDFSEENLAMCSYIAKAQAQYCAFEKVRRNQIIKPNLLSQLAMQASVFYDKAYSFAISLSMNKAANLKTFITILQFNKHSFEAQANYWMAQQFLTEIKEGSSNMGNAIAYITKACESLETIKEESKAYSSMISSQYKNLLLRYLEQKSKLIEINDKMYHDSIPSKINNIDCLQFSEPFSLDDELGCLFEGRDLISRMIPQDIQCLDRKRVG